MLKNGSKYKILCGERKFNMKKMAEIMELCYNELSFYSKNGI